MHAKDLNAVAPRRWTQELGGIAWLPRLIDKTRAALAGTLGDYLYGQSPIDRELLRALGLGYRDFTQLVRDAADDEAVLAALESQVPVGVQRARAWSHKLPRRHGFFLFLLDVDDGRYGPALKRPANALSGALTRWVKRRWPSKAAEIER